jgi:hypothetical protein
VGGGELVFQEGIRDKKRVRRSGGGEWRRESIQVANVWLMLRRPKWEYCHVVINSE